MIALQDITRAYRTISMLDGRIICDSLGETRVRDQAGCKEPPSP